MNSNSQDKFVKLHKAILSRRDLTPATKLIYSYIVDQIGDKSYAWPGWRRIGMNTGLSLNAVKAAIKAIDKVKLLTIEPQNSGRPNRYRKRAPQGSATPMEALPPEQRSATLRGAQALPSGVHNQTDLLQTQQQVVAEELENCGVLDPKRTEILKCHPGLTVQVVKELYGRIGSSAKNPPAVLVKLIDSEASKLIERAQKRARSKNQQAEEAKRQREAEQEMAAQRREVSKRETEQVDAMSDDELERRAEAVLAYQPQWLRQSWRKSIKSDGLRKAVQANWVFRSRICKDAEVADDQRRSSA